MGVYTHIDLLNANDPEFVKAKNGTAEEQEAWQDNNGTFEDRPGAPYGYVDGGFYTETDDEYGGWLIKVSDIPKDATHIIIHRS